MGDVKILFNEIHVTQDEFDGNRPDAGADIAGPNHGSIRYGNCSEAGLFEFQVGQPHGADPLDWIRVERILLYLDEANITDVSLVIIPPEGNAFPIPFIRDLTEWENGGMERLLFLNGAQLRLRPGCKLKLTTADAAAPQMAEVWWERERQIRADIATGNEVFAYGV